MLIHKNNVGGRACEEFETTLRIPHTSYAKEPDDQMKTFHKKRSE